MLREEHDEIAAAQRALRQAEKAHERAIALAQRQLRAARTAEPLSAYGHEVILYADRLSTAGGNHELTPEVRARIEDTPGTGRFHRQLTLKIEGPNWRREVTFPRRDARRMRGWPRRSSPPPATPRRSVGRLEPRLSRRSGTWRGRGLTAARSRRPAL